MRKLILSTLVIAAAFIMVSCSNNSPKAAAEAYAAATMKGDYQKAIDMVYFKGTPEDVQKQKEFYLNIINDKVKDGLPEEKQMTKYEVTNEEIDEENGRATITANVTYADGHSKEEKTKMVKTEDGNWMVDGEK